MIKFFTRNALTLQLLFLALCFSWIHGGTRPDLLLNAIPWIALFVLEIALIFPQARTTETIADARDRVLYKLFRDPLFYIALLQTIILAIPLFNVAGAPTLDPATGKWVNPVPPFPYLPSCCDFGEHASLLLWFPPTMIATLAAKHGLLKRGKRILLEALCWNGAALALFGFIQMATGATSVFWGAEKFSTFFATFGYPNVAGAFFTLLFALSTGIWCSQFAKYKIGPFATDTPITFESAADRPSPFYTNRMLLPIALNFFAALATLSRAAILLSFAIFIFMGLYIAIGCLKNSDTVLRVKITSSMVIVVTILVLSVTIFASAGLKRELDTISWDAITARVSGSAQYHVRVAKEIFKDHPVFGVGGWGYPHYQMQYMTPKELKSMQIVGGINVHNDTMQFLAEQGIVGYGLIVLCALFTAFPLIRVVFSRWKFANKIAQPVQAPRFVYCQSAVTVATFVGTAGTIVHSLGDIPFRCPAVLLIWFLALACAPGFTPSEKKH